MVKYTLYVDESGDTGLDNIRSGAAEKGASPFLVFGGCLMPKCYEGQNQALLQQVRDAIRTENLHCNKLSHFQTAKFARMVAKEGKVQLFSLVSKKETLGEFKKVISGKGQDQKYYNKCVSYLLERVGDFMLTHKVDGNDLEIVFENRARHDYEKLQNYIAKIKSNPLDERLGYFLGPIRSNCIRSEAKESCDLLCYADLVAHAVFSAVNPSRANYDAPEQRYMRELKSKFFCDRETGVIGEFGLKLFKRFDAGFDPETKRFLDSWHKANVIPKVN